MNPPSRLRQAIAELGPGRGSRAPEMPLALWASIARGCIDAWAAELQRDLAKAETALGRADEIGLSDSGVEAVEEALWRSRAAMERFEVVFALVFGVPSLQLEKKTMVRFEPSTDAAKSRLAELAQSDPSAKALVATWRALLGHPFITLRNQLVHSLAPLAEARPLCYFDLAIARGTNVIGYESKIHYPANYTAKTAEGESIDPAALYARAVTLGMEAVEQLRHAVDLLADVIEKTDALPDAQRVYFDLDTETLSLERQ